MTTSRAFWDAIDQAKRARREAEADDVEMGDYDDDIGDELADREFDWFVCPVCGGRRTIQPYTWNPPEPCPRCVDEDADA